MVRRARCWRVHSTLTQKVNTQKCAYARFHAAYSMVSSGQLRFLGSWDREVISCCRLTFAQHAQQDTPSDQQQTSHQAPVHGFVQKKHSAHC